MSGGELYLTPLCLSLNSSLCYIQKLCDDALWFEPAENTCGVQGVVPSVAPGSLGSVSTPLLTEDERRKRTEQEIKNTEAGTTRRKPRIIKHL